MKPVETTNPIVINEEQISNIVQLVFSTYFRGISDWEDESLFDFGWLYDDNTKTVITTKKHYMWKNMNSPLKFRVFILDEAILDAKYEKNEVLLLEYNDDIDNWYDLSIYDKLHYLEIFDSFLSKHNDYTEYSIDELIEYLTNYIEINNPNLK